MRGVTKQLCFALLLQNDGAGQSTGTHKEIENKKVLHWPLESLDLNLIEINEVVMLKPHLMLLN